MENRIYNIAPYGKSQLYRASEIRQKENINRADTETRLQKRIREVRRETK